MNATLDLETLPRLRDEAAIERLCLDRLSEAGFMEASRPQPGNQPQKYEPEKRP
jgi:hypothetical protein